VLYICRLIQIHVKNKLFNVSYLKVCVVTTFNYYIDFNNVDAVLSLINSVV